MNYLQRQYYQEMLGKGRLIPFTYNNRLVCFITYWITNEDSKNPWLMIEEEPNGNVCYIDQLITNKHSENPKLSYSIWQKFRTYVKIKHPSVTQIRWRRFKGGKVNVYNKDID